MSDPQPPPTTPSGRQYRLERPGFVRGLIYLGIALLLALLLLDGLVSIWHIGGHHHEHFEKDGITIDTWPEFYPLYGFLSCLVLVLVAKTLGLLLKRRDTYYHD